MTRTVWTRDKDRGFKRIVATLRDAARSEVAIGWFPDAEHGKEVLAERSKLTRRFESAEKGMNDAVARAEANLKAGKRASIAISRMTKLRATRAALEAHEKRHGGSLDVVTTASIAASHEFGTDSTPERPILRPVVDGNRLEYRKLVRRLWDKVCALEITIEGALVVLGSRIESDVKRWITDGPHLPNSPATIARKGSSRPLIDTGVMRDQVMFRYQVGGRVKT